MERGFTLIELLAVIVILAIIALIAVPIVINIINDAKKSSQEESLKMYGKAVEQGISNYLLKNLDNENITLKELEDNNFINYTGEKIDCNTFQIGKNGEVYLADCSINGERLNYVYGKYDPKPELAQGLTPVIYDGNNWKIVSSSDKNWYDYDKQKWANAVVLKSGSTKKVGDVVTVEGEDPDALMMYVWIPRYEYKIEGKYGTHTNGTIGTQEQPGEIKVEFISKTTITPTEGYRIHPAFTFGETEESGFWVGKFELSHTEFVSNQTANNLGCNENGCISDISKMRIIPGIKSLRYNNISNLWYGIKAIENTASFGLANIDIHMIKNSEWGAVAYLSQSKYGKYGNKDYEGVQKEIYINNSQGYYTGRSGGHPGGSTPINETYTNKTSTELYNNSGFYAYDGYLLEYSTNNRTETRNINKGTGASTTGNIYGVYDMSGCAVEYVMSAYGTETEGIYSGYKSTGNESTWNSGFNGKTGNDNKMITDGAQVPDSKYYDEYFSKVAESACKNGEIYELCYGHGLSETRGWYNDTRSAPSNQKPWLARGGDYETGVGAGIFYFYQSTGGDNSNRSTRIVGIVE